MLPSTRDALLANRRVELIETAHGGHCAFLAPPAAGYDGYWAEKTTVGLFAFGHETLMEADWSVALAAGDPVITVPWAASSDDVKQCRFVDLRRSLRWIDEIEEARAKPRLRSACCC